MKISERFLNLSFGLSLIYWGVAGIYYNYEAFDTPPIRIFITLLNFSVGLLIIFRMPVISKGSLRSVLISLPSLLCGGLLFKFAKPLDTWSNLPSIVFFVGGTIAISSFLFLGRSFSIFPDVRSIVSKGLFQFVRHPSYLGETLMLIACLIAAQSFYSIIPFLLFIPGIIIRINEEENLLRTSASYQKYQEEVKWRLIPYVW